MKIFHILLLFFGVFSTLAGEEHVLEKRNRISSRATANRAARQSYHQAKGNVYAQARNTFAKAQQPKNAKQRALAFLFISIKESR
jgi:hypothetical protein